MQELRDNEQPWRSATLLFTRIRNRVPQLLYHLSFWKTASTVSFIVREGLLFVGRYYYCLILYVGNWLEIFEIAAFRKIQCQN